MRKRKFYLIETTCKRCGCTLYTGNRSLYFSEEIKAKYDRICSDCITKEEKEEILKLKPTVK